MVGASKANNAAKSEPLALNILTIYAPYLDRQACGTDRPMHTQNTRRR